MNEAAGEAFGKCPSNEIGAYLDAELSAERAAALEEHFAVCPVCRGEMNSQKAFLLELSRTLEADAAIELPKEFTKSVVTRAESSVSGLRKSSERAAAFGIVVLLVVLAAAGFAGDWGRVSTEAARPMSTFVAVIDAVLAVCYNVGFAFAFLAKKVFGGGGGTFGTIATAAVVLIFGYFVLRRFRRAPSEAA